MNIAIAAIALSITVMILATSIVRGFKTTISEKIFGFWGHIHITSSYAPSSYAFETSPMNINQDYYTSLDSIKNIQYSQEEIDIFGQLKTSEKTSKAGIRHIQTFAQKEGIIKANEQIEGIILRGVGKDYDWNFIKKYLKSGTVLDSKNSLNKDEILLSETTARRLKLKVGDDFLIYFV
jgi:lipoprotein-releasing system permease protein